MAESKANSKKTLVNTSTRVYLDGVKKEVVIIGKERCDANALTIEQVKALKTIWKGKSRKLVVEEEQVEQA